MILVLFIIPKILVILTVLEKSGHLKKSSCDLVIIIILKILVILTVLMMLTIFTILVVLTVLEKSGHLEKSSYDLVIVIILKIAIILTGHNRPFRSTNYSDVMAAILELGSKQKKGAKQRDPCQLIAIT